eukprot:TRINITY_DN811_c0_g2_i2.p1 TRINITY_DN811_c0_g2~~TRINITY_DN811_c0_g2_i2.p1  ORF type:complete len:421 (+),score=63.24 TRINITY_DN811_c0_g2_i2:105-1367(+)
MNPGDSDQVILSDFESDSLDGDHAVADGEQHKQGDAGNEPGDASGSDLEGSNTHGAGVDVHSASDVNGEITESEGSCANHDQGTSGAATPLVPATPRKSSGRQPLASVYGIKQTPRGACFGRLHYGGKELSTPACRTVQEAAFMRNFAASVLFPGNESKLTVVEGGLHFPPEREAAMREIMTKKISELRRKTKTARRGVEPEQHSDAQADSSDAGDSSAGDDVPSEPPAPAAAAAKHTDAASEHQRFASPSTKGPKGTIRTDDNKYISRLWLGNVKRYIRIPKCDTVQEAAFMRNYALAVLCPGDESRQTIIEGGLHFTPEQERKMRETVAKHLRRLGLTVASTPRSTQASESEQDGDGASDSSSAKPHHTSSPAVTGGRRRSAKARSSATGDARNRKNKTGFYGVQGHNSCFLGAVQLK